MEGTRTVHGLGRMCIVMTFDPRPRCLEVMDLWQHYQRGAVSKTLSTEPFLDDIQRYNKHDEPMLLFP